MTTLLTIETADARADESTPGCGCCIPPPDTVDTRRAELEARKARLEAKLRAIGAQA